MCLKLNQHRVCVRFSVTTGALGGWAGHSWPQGSPDYVYDSRVIIRAGYEGRSHTQSMTAETGT